jgi:hypothetical protein
MSPRRRAERRGEHPCQLIGVSHRSEPQTQLRVDRAVGRRPVEHQRML